MKIMSLISLKNNSLKLYAWFNTSSLFKSLKLSLSTGGVCSRVRVDFICNPVVWKLSQHILVSFWETSASHKQTVNNTAPAWAHSVQMSKLRGACSCRLRVTGVSPLWHSLPGVCGVCCLLPLPLIYHGSGVAGLWEDVLLWNISSIRV